MFLFFYHKDLMSEKNLEEISSEVSTEIKNFFNAFENPDTEPFSE